MTAVSCSFLRSSVTAAAARLPLALLHPGRPLQTQAPFIFPSSPPLLPPLPPPRRRPPSKFVVPGESNFNSSLLHLPLPLRGSFEHPPARFLRGRGLPTITSARRRSPPSGCLTTATPRRPKLWVSLASPDAFLVHAPAVPPLASLVTPLESRLTDGVGGGAGHGRHLLA